MRWHPLPGFFNIYIRSFKSVLFVHPSSTRTAGVLIPAFSPRRKGDLGIGDTLALREWIDWAAAHQVGFLQFLPINEHGEAGGP